MTCVFISSYFSHHHKPFSDAMDNHNGNHYYFIETSPMTQERLNLGWKTEYPPYVKRIYDSEESRCICQDLIDSADVAVIGSAPEELIRPRLKSGKLTFRYSERIYKSGYQWYKYPKRLPHYYFKFGRYKNLYMLCASAYTAADFAKTGTFIGKTYKWGYFLNFRRYDHLEELMNKKESVSILWTARFIGWKHPEMAIKTAKQLKEAGYRFKLRMIGTGPLTQLVEIMINEYGLNDCVEILGPMSPDQVRDYMERSEIFLFTSDFNEGWGAVLNEAMNSGCACVANHGIGAAPYLIKNKENGLLYKNGDQNDIYRTVEWLIKHPQQRHLIGIQAYQTIAGQWNAENAAIV